MIFQWNFWYFHQVISHECEITSVYCIYNLTCVFWGSTFDDFNLSIGIPLRKWSFLFARQVFCSQNIHSISLDNYMIIVTDLNNYNWFYDNSICQFGPCIGIIYLKLMTFWIFAHCNKNSLCKSLVLVCTCPFVINTYPSPVRSHFVRTRPLEDKFWKLLIHLRNNSSSRGRISNGNVYVCDYGLSNSSNFEKTPPSGPSGYPSWARKLLKKENCGCCVTQICRVASLLTGWAFYFHSFFYIKMTIMLWFVL